MAEAAGAFPELGSGGVYLYAHANGAISLSDAPGANTLVTLDEAIGVTSGYTRDGLHVAVGRDDAPIAIRAVEAVRSAGVEFEVFDASHPPVHWPRGTDAVMEAAAQKDDRRLVDLLSRGASTTGVDESDSTALHHAAANGNRVAIDVLEPLGTDLDHRNKLGHTAYQMAVIGGFGECIERLAELGADTSIGRRDTVKFAGRSLLMLWVSPLLAVVMLGIVGAFTWPWGLLDVLVLAVIVVVYAAVTPPRAAWAGGAPRSLTGPVVTLRTATGRSREVDLSDVTFAATGGLLTANQGAGWLVLGHPDGHRVGTARELNRLSLTKADRDEMMLRASNVLVIPLRGGASDTVLCPIGNVLTARRTDMTSTMRDQLRFFNDWHVRNGDARPTVLAVRRDRRRPKF